MATPSSDANKAPAEPKLPHKPSASRSEGSPHFTTAVAAGDLPPAEPTVTQASPDVPDAGKPAPELAGSDLQPVEGRDPQGGGAQEPVPRAKPQAPQSEMKSQLPSSEPAQGHGDPALPEGSASGD
jgi:hypothetical protein